MHFPVKAMSRSTGALCPRSSCPVMNLDVGEGILVVLTALFPPLR